MPNGHDFLSPRDFGAAIGISESTIKRWVDTGEVRVMRTPGGHRRIPRSEAVRFIRDHHCTLADPGLLGLDDGLAPAPITIELTEQVHAALVAGDEPVLRRLLIGAYLGGARLAELGDGPVRSAMQRIGTLWQHSDDGIAIEHHAVQVLLRMLLRLRQYLALPPAEAPAALGGAPAGDPYLLGSALAEMCLLEAGWRTMNLGPDSPLGAFRAAMARMRPRVVWLSLSSPPGSGQAEAVTELADQCQRTGAHLVVGGRCVDELGLDEATPCERARSLADLVELVRALHPAA